MFILWWIGRLIEDREVRGGNEVLGKIVGEWDGKCDVVGGMRG